MHYNNLEVNKKFYNKEKIISFSLILLILWSLQYTKTYKFYNLIKYSFILEY